ncbi:MAG: hypothetical protein ACRDCC_05545, partial [Culicoidibacterales bacterium]
MATSKPSFLKVSPSILEFILKVKLNSSGRRKAVAITGVFLYNTNRSETAWRKKNGENNSSW